MENEVVVVDPPAMQPESQMIVYDLPIKDRLIEAAQGRLATLRSIDLVDDDMMEIAAGELRTTKAIATGLDALWGASRKPVKLALNAIDDIYSEALQIYDTGITECSRRMVQYRETQLKRAADARAVAEKLAETERRRIAFAANALEAEGRPEEAQATRAMAAVVHVPPEVGAPPKVEGTSFRKNWKSRVVDKDALGAHILANPEFRECWEPIMKKFDQMAKAQEAGLAIPGIEAYNDVSVASRKER